MDYTKYNKDYLLNILNNGFTSVEQAKEFGEFRKEYLWLVNHLHVGDNSCKSNAKYILTEMGFTTESLIDLAKTLDSDFDNCVNTINSMALALKSNEIKHVHTKYNCGYNEPLRTSVNSWLKKNNKSNGIWSMYSEFGIGYNLFGSDYKFSFYTLEREVNKEKLDNNKYFFIESHLVGMVNQTIENLDRKSVEYIRENDDLTILNTETYQMYQEFGSLIKDYCKIGWGSNEYSSVLLVFDKETSKHRELTREELLELNSALKKIKEFASSVGKELKPIEY